MKQLLLFCLPVLFAVAGRAIAQPDTASAPTISFTFDDGSVSDMPGYPLEVWNAMILGHLQAHEAKAILFSTGSNKTGEKGRYVLQSWNDAGHRIANHTMTHLNFGSQKASVELFRQELLANDSINRSYSNYMAYFRFPYLKEGRTAETVQGYRLVMQEYGYRNGHVTVDASDWYVSSRLVRRLEEDPGVDIEGFRKFYLEHLFSRAEYYENLSYQLTGRHIRHTILLHHNLAAALFLGDLLQYFKDRGWRVVDADKAYDDEIYNTVTTRVPAGESLIWSIAKESGRYENQLRYPAEDGDYEKEKMDDLGL